MAPGQDWETPLGRVAVDPLAQDFLARCPTAREDGVPHEQEHSLEVQLPFLQKMNHPFSIVPIVLGTWDLGVLKKIGACLAESILGSKKRICLLASSDMNHFEDLERTRRLDHMALEKVLALDPEGLMRVVEAEDISMCGAAPAAAMLFAAKLLGAQTAELADYGTSADTSGDEERVVGYAGVIIK
jgi:AmmeMemoRadiSam system protein B